MNSTAWGFAFVGTTFALGAQAACYTVYQANNLVFQSFSTPVDLSRRLGDTVPARFGPGATMVTSIDSDGCREISGVAALSDASVASLDGAGARRGSSPQGGARPTANLGRFFNGQASPMETRGAGVAAPVQQQKARR